MNARLKLIVAMLIWGSLGVFVRHIPLSSSSTALIRGIIGAAFLIFLFLFKKQRWSRSAIQKNAVLLIASGAALGVNWIFLFEAYKFTSIANATLSYYMAPIMITIASALILKEKLSALQAVFVGTALLGIVFVSGVFSSAPHAHDLKGIRFGVMAAASYAGLTIANKFIKDLSSLEATIFQLMVASAVLFPYVLATEYLTAFAVSAQVWILLIILGVIHTGLAFWFYFSSIPQLPAQSIAVMSYIDPLTAIVLAALLLCEPVRWTQAVGAVLILGSVFLSERLGNRTRKNIG